jgi:hypothetical protein
MKKHLLFLTFMLTFICVNAQIKTVTSGSSKIVLGEVKSAGKFVAEIYYRPEAGKDTTYFCMYRNEEYTTLTDIQSFYFDGEDGALMGFYNTILEVIKPENLAKTDYSITVKLGKTNVNIGHYGNPNNPRIMIYTSDGYFTLSRSQVDTLFGIKKGSATPSK